jgi:hypothetical protein
VRRKWNNTTTDDIFVCDYFYSASAFDVGA